MEHQHALFVYPYRKSHIANGNIYIPPVGLEHIAAAVKDLLKEITVIDMRFENDVRAFIKKTTTFIGVCINWDYDEDEVAELIDSFPHEILTVVGGRDASRNPQKYLNRCPNIDVAVVGDGEASVRDIINGKPYETIKNIAYRSNGAIVQKPFEFIDVVDNSIYPDRRFRRYSYAIQYEGWETGLSYDIITSSRGCPYNCKICTCNSNPDGTKRKWSGRSPESIVKEIDEMQANFIFFADVNFFNDRDRVVELCDLIIKRGIKKHFSVQVRLDIAKHPEMLEKMQKAGITHIMIGIESPHDWILKEANKEQTQQDIRDAFKVLTRYKNLLLQGFFVVGYPGETEEEMKYCSRFAKEIGVDIMATQRLRCAPNNPQLRALIAATPGYHVGHDELVYSDKYSNNKLKEILDSINKDFFVKDKTGMMFKRPMKLMRSGYITKDLIGSLMQSGFRKITGRKSKGFLLESKQIN